MIRTNNSQLIEQAGPQLNNSPLFSKYIFLKPQVFKKINHVSFIPSKEVFYFYFFNIKTSPFILCFVSLLVIYTSPQLGSQIYIGINLVF